MRLLARYGESSFDVLNPADLLRSRPAQSVDGSAPHATSTFCRLHEGEDTQFRAKTSRGIVRTHSIYENTGEFNAGNLSVSEAP
jgi:hypothetical protein